MRPRATFSKDRRPALHIAAARLLSVATLGGTFGLTAHAETDGMTAAPQMSCAEFSAMDADGQMQAMVTMAAGAMATDAMAADGMPADGMVNEAMAADGMATGAIVNHDSQMAVHPGGRAGVDLLEQRAWRGLLVDLAGSLWRPLIWRSAWQPSINFGIAPSY